MNPYAVFDIETGPRPLADIEAVMPVFRAPSNYKDPAKIAAVLQEQRAEWIQRAALDATTGEVLVIGVLDTDAGVMFLEGDEAEILTQWWDLMRRNLRYWWAGWNIVGFDLPFLVQRSWLHSIRVPNAVLEISPWRPDPFVDLMLTWSLGDRHKRLSLDTAAKFLGVGQKNGDGAKFAKTYATNRDEALAYLRNDLELTARVAERMAIIQAKLKEGEGDEDGF